jgi:hypothetical protein
MANVSGLISMATTRATLGFNAKFITSPPTFAVPFIFYFQKVKIKIN